MWKGVRQAEIRTVIEHFLLTDYTGVVGIKHRSVVDRLADEIVQIRVVWVGVR